MSIFQKVWEWLGLVWKMSGDLGGVFLSYLEPPNSHIIRNQQNETTNPPTPWGHQACEV